MSRNGHVGGFLDLDQDEQLPLLDWIYKNLRLGQGWDMTRNSYSLKRLYEEHTRHYVTNAQFEDEMIISGYQPKNRHELNLQTGGNLLVWFSLTWSLQLYQQANARWSM